MNYCCHNVLFRFPGTILLQIWFILLPKQKWLLSKCQCKWSPGLVRHKLCTVCFRRRTCDGGVCRQCCRGYSPTYVGVPRNDQWGAIHYRSTKGAIGASTMSGCISEETFLVFLEHIAQHASCSSDDPMLLILDSHEAHCCPRAAETARTKGIIRLTIPPHTSHQLLPLDKSVFGPFRAIYNKALDCWMQFNPGKTMTIDDIPQCMNKAFQSAMTS